MSLAVVKTAEWHAARKKGIGGSDANKIAAGDPAQLIDLWLEKIGEREPEDLTWVLPVQIGSVTEELNCAWYAHVTGRALSDRNRCFNHANGFMRCEVDGLTTNAAGHPAILEAKHVNAFGNIEDVVQRYMGQLHHNMHCAGVDHAVLSIIQGTQKYEVFEVECDPFYLADLIELERKFWDCVLSGEPPAAISLAAPVAPESMIEVDMEGHNEFAAHAADWLAHKDSAKAHEKAKEEIKGLMQPNWKKATGYGLQVSRAKTGALTIKEISNAAK